MSSDERLALRAAQGDQRAFEQIYARYNQDLYRFCLAMVGNPQDAQDALQNTMVKVLRSLPGETREIRLKPWLYRIARNESVEALRKRRETAVLEPQQVPVAAVTETAEMRERLRTLLADLEQLPERQRAALVMRELAGLDFEQIGAAFGTSAAVARQTLYEARLSLRQLEAGREMRCAEVMQELSNADGRITRRREIRAHLRSCADCRAFRDDIARRHEDLAALAPLPLAASAGVLQDVLGSGAGAEAGGIAAGGGAGVGVSASGGGLGTIGAGAGKAIAGSAIAKSVATAAVVAVVGVSAADRTGLIHLPLPDRGGAPPAQRVPARSVVPADAAAGSAAAIAEPSASAAAESDAAGRSVGAERDGDRSDQSAGSTGDVQGANSPSEAGQAPPGGGHGRSASENKGPPAQLPAASEKGQQNAAANKPPQAGPPSQSGARGGKPAGVGTPPPKPVPPETGASEGKKVTPPSPELPPQAAPESSAGATHKPEHPSKGAPPSG